MYYANHLEEAIVSYKVLEPNPIISCTYISGHGLLLRKTELALAEMRTLNEMRRSFGLILTYEALGRKKK
jgi:hypothetical protein